MCAEREANSTDEIEITAEMVEAGFQVLVASGITGDPLEADKLLVEEIYQAMFVRRPQAGCVRR